MSKRFVNLDECELVGHIGVDSGQMMLGDPCYLDEWGGGEFTSVGENKPPNGAFNYDGACRATTSGKQAGLLGNGVAKLAAVTSTGFGDGQYPVYVEISDEGAWGKRVKSMTIVFIDDSEEEEDEDHCENCGADLVGFMVAICDDCAYTEQEEREEDDDE